MVTYADSVCNRFGAFIVVIALEFHLEVLQNENPRACSVNLFAWSARLAISMEHVSLRLVTDGQTHTGQQQYVRDNGY